MIVDIGGTSTEPISFWRKCSHLVTSRLQNLLIVLFSRNSSEHTYVGGLPRLLVRGLLAVFIVLVVGVAGAQMSDVALPRLEVRVAAVALEQRRRLGHLGGYVQLVLVPVPTGSRR